MRVHAYVSFVMLAGMSGCTLWYGAGYMPGAQVKKILASENTAEPLIGRITSSFEPVPEKALAKATNGGYTLEYVGVKGSKVCFLTTGMGWYRDHDENGEAKEERAVRASFNDDRLTFQARTSLDELSPDAARWPKNPPSQVESIEAAVRSQKHVDNVLGIRGEADPGTKLVYDVTICGPAPAMNAQTKYLTVMRLPHAQMGGMGGTPSLFVWIVDPNAAGAASTTTAKSDDAKPVAAPVVSNDLLGVLTKDGHFTVFLKAIAQADLGSALTGRDRMTVFAPTDDAFAAYGDAKLNKLLGDPVRLKDVLQNHIVSRAFPSNQFTGSTTARPTVLSTIGGKSIRVRKAKGKVIVEGRAASTVDIHADNGVIHALDGVLDL